MAFTDYAFYSGTYHGKLNESKYDSAVNKAYAEIISQTNGLASTAPENMQTPLKMCECELVDAIYSFAQVPTGISSINNDGYSVVYGGRNSNDGLSGEDDTYKTICTRYLQCPVNLMCRWL